MTHGAYDISFGHPGLVYEQFWHFEHTPPTRFEHPEKGETPHSGRVRETLG